MNKVEVKNSRPITQSEYIESSCKQFGLILVSIGPLDEGASSSTDALREGGGSAATQRPSGK